MPIVCTEAGYQADVLGISATTVIEVEVKCSASDMRAEFAKKTLKHEKYLDSMAQKEPRGSYVPNYWYLFVDVGLRERALELLEEKAPYAGLLVRHHPAYQKYGAGGYNVLCDRKAKRIHNKPPRPLFVRGAIMRMSSALVGWHLMAGAKFGDEQTMSSVITERLHAVEGVLDFEDTDRDLERRGAELAWVVTQTPWEKIKTPERLIWCMKAQQILSLRQGPFVEAVNAAV
jgi:hypothetical protein